MNAEQIQQDVIIADLLIRNLRAQGTSKIRKICALSDLHQLIKILLEYKVYRQIYSLDESFIFTLRRIDELVQDWSDGKSGTPDSILSSTSVEFLLKSLVRIHG